MLNPTQTLNNFEAADQYISSQAERIDTLELENVKLKKELSDTKENYEKLVSKLYSLNTEEPITPIKRYFSQNITSENTELVKYEDYLKEKTLMLDIIAKLRIEKDKLEYEVSRINSYFKSLSAQTMRF
jgi:hypothetical protein